MIELDEPVVRDLLHMVWKALQENDFADSGIIPHPLKFDFCNPLNKGLVVCSHIFQKTVLHQHSGFPRTFLVELSYLWTRFKMGWRCLHRDDGVIVTTIPNSLTVQSLEEIALSTLLERFQPWIIALNDVQL